MAPKTVIERLGLLACLLVGCRGVLGVEDLHVEVDGGSGLDGGLDAVAMTDAGEDADAGTPDADAAKPDLAACGAWCATDGGLADAAATFYGDMSSCMCKGSKLQACATECAGLCPNGTVSSFACEACILQEAFGAGGVCFAKAGNCSKPCTDFGQCVTSCP